MVYYSTIGQLSYLGEISVLGHFNETASLDYKSISALLWQCCYSAFLC